MLVALHSILITRETLFLCAATFKIKKVACIQTSRMLKITFLMALKNMVLDESNGKMQGLSDTKFLVFNP